MMRIYSIPANKPTLSLRNIQTDTQTDTDRQHLTSFYEALSQLSLEWNFRAYTEFM